MARQTLYALTLVVLASLLGTSAVYTRSRLFRRYRADRPRHRRTRWGGLVERLAPRARAR